MEIDPHTLQQILNRIYKQMRCPQCGSRVPVDFSTVRVVASGSLLLQLKCETCNSFIVLQASLQGAEDIVAEEPVDETSNASTNLKLPEEEMLQLTEALKQSDGSFETLFKTYGSAEEKSADS